MWKIGRCTDGGWHVSGSGGDLNELIVGPAACNVHKTTTWSATIATVLEDIFEWREMKR
jgi:hypothetical protein